MYCNSEKYRDESEFTYPIALSHVSFGTTQFCDCTYAKYISSKWVETHLKQPDIPDCLQTQLLFQSLFVNMRL